MSEDPKDVALSSIRNLTHALELAWRGAGIPAKEMADRLGIEYGHFVRMFRQHDSRHFPPDLILTVMDETGSLLPLEWLAWKKGYRLHEMALTAILSAIRDAFHADGKDPKFAFCGHGRIERAERAK